MKLNEKKEGRFGRPGATTTAHMIEYVPALQLKAEC